MGLFGRLFEKKNCAICGKELGVFGKKKIADGHLCKDCAGQLSPYFTGHRQATTEDIRAQLAYREQNKAAVAQFTVTRTIGNDTKVFLDEDARKVIVSRHPSSQWATQNPDVIDYARITGCDYNVEETSTEIYREDSEGNSVSYDPPRYEYDYNIYITIFVNNPYFDRIHFKLNNFSMDRQGSAEFRRCEQQAIEIKDALTGIHAEQRAAAAPKTAMTCPHCGATTMPDANGRCEYCGGAMLA